MEGYIGAMSYFGGDWAPRNWAQCNGQLLAINTNTALFSILGTTYGGNGVTTFALPDVRGRLLVSNTTTTPPPGVSVYSLGEMTGNSTVTLTTANMPQHTHTVNPTLNLAVNNGTGGTAADNPSGAFFGTNSANTPFSTTGSSAGSALHNNVTVGIAGSSMPVSTAQPFLGITHIICLYGIYPSRN